MVKTEAVVEIPYLFENVEVVGADAVVRKTGDGLSEELHFAPFVVHKGERKCLVLDVECTDVQHPWVDKKDHSKGATRRHVFDAETALFLDADIVRAAIEEQKLRIAKFRDEEIRRKEEEKGIFRFDSPVDEDEDEDLEVAVDDDDELEELVPVGAGEDEDEPF